MVLRWFEKLPELDPGEDIDLLVSDKHLLLINEYLKGNKKNGIPCDIYTCGGLPGTDYRSVPYYPVKIAEKIVAESILLSNNVKAPNKKHHLLSMIYHAVYHKGFNSCIASRLASPEDSGQPDHDYISIIKELGNAADVKLPEEISLESLDKYLYDNGWRPQNDTLKKLSRRNSWIAKYFFSDEKEIALHWSGFTLFIIREKGLEYLDKIKSYLWSEGFEIILEEKIPPEKRDSAINNIRGGNWNRGPWPESGGNPVYVLAVYDLHPLEVDKTLAEKHIGIENARISNTKIKIRDYINTFKNKNEWCNVLHSADNPVEALEYVKNTIPDKLEIIEKAIVTLNNNFKTPYKVIRNLSRHARRAKIEIVDFNGSVAICKTFKPGRERFMEREILARKIKGSLNTISEILEIGNNYIILKKYEDIIDSIYEERCFLKGKKYFPVHIIREIRNILIHYRQLGYEVIDFSPNNLIYDRNEGLKAIDFEFLQKGEKSENGLKGCYAWYNIPEDFKGDSPKYKTHKTFYRARWQERTGLPLVFCVYDFPEGLLLAIQVFQAYLAPAIHKILRIIKYFILIPLKILKRIKKIIIKYLNWNNNE